MQISLAPETAKLLKSRMKKEGIVSPDDAVRLASQTLNDIEAESLESRGAETQAAIKRAEMQAARGEGRPWPKVRQALLIQNPRRRRDDQA